MGDRREYADSEDDKDNREEADKKTNSITKGGPAKKQSVDPHGEHIRLGYSRARATVD